MSGTILDNNVLFTQGLCDSEWNSSTPDLICSDAVPRSVRVHGSLEEFTSLKVSYHEWSCRQHTAVGNYNHSSHRTDFFSTSHEHLYTLDVRQFPPRSGKPAQQCNLREHAKGVPNNKVVKSRGIHLALCHKAVVLPAGYQAGQGSDKGKQNTAIRSISTVFVFWEN